MAKLNKDIFSIIQRIGLPMWRNFSRAQIAPLQEAALEERCILVDDMDRVLGNASKRDCHRISKDDNILLHRAFSVFMFNKEGDLLLQKRSGQKVTFPGHYTNTCCSHPLAEIPEETIEDNALGIQRAAQRRLNYELGIQIQPAELLYLTRIHYRALGDGYWGEHEIDYVLFVQKDGITPDPNPDEVSEIKWVKRSEIHQFIKNVNSPLTPWFHLILKNKLFYWWDNLQTLDKVKDHSVIQRFL